MAIYENLRPGNMSRSSSYGRPRQERKETRKAAFISSKSEGIKGAKSTKPTSRRSAANTKVFRDHLPAHWKDMEYESSLAPGSLPGRPELPKRKSRSRLIRYADISEGRKLSITHAAAEEDDLAKQFNSVTLKPSRLTTR